MKIREECCCDNYNCRNKASILMVRKMNERYLTRYYCVCPLHFDQGQFKDRFKDRFFMWRSRENDRE